MADGLTQNLFPLVLITGVLHESRIALKFSLHSQIHQSHHHCIWWSSNIQQLHWNTQVFWAYDQGHVHTHLIKNSFYAPGAHVCLLSPWHWMQNMAPQFASTASCTTHTDKIILRWATHQRSVPLDSNNIATFYLDRGYKPSQAFVYEFGLDIQE
jgi:hypothetical protein